MKKLLCLFTLSLASLTISLPSYGNWISSKSVDQMTEKTSAIAMSKRTKDKNRLAFQCREGAADNKRFVIRAAKVFAAPSVEAKVMLRIDKGEVIELKARLSGYKSIAIYSSDAGYEPLVKAMRSGSKIMFRANAEIGGGYIDDSTSLKGFSEEYDKMSESCQ